MSRKAADDADTAHANLRCRRSRYDPPPRGSASPTRVSSGARRRAARRA